MNCQVYAINFWKEIIILMLNISAEHKKEHLYLEVYHYYRKLILEGRLLPGSKMPSLRKCAQELKLSRTTIENAYLLLAADGYIIARAQSGYYVTGIASKQHLLTPEKQDKDITPCLYDFASSGVDRESFRFDLWQRYIKSALRQGDRMLSYGEPRRKRFPGGSRRLYPGTQKCDLLPRMTL